MERKEDETINAQIRNKITPLYNLVELIKMGHIDYVVEHISEYEKAIERILEIGVGIPTIK